MSTPVTPARRRGRPCRISEECVARVRLAAAAGVPYTVIGREFAITATYARQLALRLRRAEVEG